MSAPSAAATYLRRRREALAVHPGRLGLDFIEILASPDPTGVKTLVLHFVPDESGQTPGKHTALDALTAGHLRFSEDGVAVDGLFEVESVTHTGEEAEVAVAVRFAGDSEHARRSGTSPIFTLEVVDFPDLDPFFSCLDFSLDLLPPLELDCQELCPPPPAMPSPAWIDYQARDYDSFRTLMLEHLGRRLPGWQERSPADGMVALVEALADAADQVAYAQDAVATEAYLGTARRRISVRRHALLTGYRLHEGANARVWAALEASPGAVTGVALEPGTGTLTSTGTSAGTSAGTGALVTGTGTAFTAELKAGDAIIADPLGAASQTRLVTAVLADAELTVDEPFDPPLAGSSFIRPGTQLLTRVPALPPGRLGPGSPDLQRALAAGPVVFETAQPAVLWPQHNEVPVYTWGAEELSLPAGATTATLVGRLPRLAAGEVLIFEEVLGRESGLAEDADPRRRRAVRLTSVRGAEDPLAGPELPPADPGTGTLTSAGTAVTGTGTSFTSELAAGDLITAADQVRRVVAVTSDTELTLEAPFQPDLAAATPFSLGRLTEVAWHPDDALPFPLCVATVVDGAPVTGVTVARGNVVLADHGRTVGQNRAFLSGTVASAGATVTGTGTAFTGELAVGDRVTASGQERQVQSLVSDSELTVDLPFDPALPAGTLLARGGLEESFIATGGRFRPRLALPDLTHREPFDPRAAAGEPACQALAQDLRQAVPVLDLRDPAEVWTLRADLLASDRFARDFVVEMEDDGTAVLRFGDGELGRPPEAGRVLAPVYRVGNGGAGNVSPESLAHLVTTVAEVDAVRNPLPARGGVDPEPLDDVRRAAPGRLLELQSRTTGEDFARAAEEHPEVERALATVRWTGSWSRLVLAVERTGGQPVDDAFRAQLAAFLEGPRLAGWELTVEPLRFVGLEIALTAFLTPGAVAGEVEQRLAEAFSNQELPGGGKGFFHPDNLGAGQPVYLSRIIDTAMQVPGVEALDVDSTPPKPNRFRRFGEPSRGELANGQIRLSGLEIPRVDNDPTAPENGTIRFFLEAGR